MRGPGRGDRAIWQARRFGARRAANLCGAYGRHQGALLWLISAAPMGAARVGLRDR